MANRLLKRCVQIALMARSVPSSNKTAFRIIICWNNIRRRSFTDMQALHTDLRWATVSVQFAGQSNRIFTGGLEYIGYVSKLRLDVQVRTWSQGDGTSVRYLIRKTGGAGIIIYSFHYRQGLERLSSRDREIHMILYLNLYIISALGTQ